MNLGATYLNHAPKEDEEEKKKTFYVLLISPSVDLPLT
jgi:hypothetical protein